MFIDLLLPGNATGILRPNAGTGKSREYQGIGNQILRTVAKNDIALIDIEKLLVFRLNGMMHGSLIISINFVGHQTIANVAMKLLSAYGELPVSI